MGWIEDFEKHKGEKWETTKLTETEEKEFQKWLSGTKWFQDMHERVKAEEGRDIPAKALLSSVVGPDSDYDYRGAWKSGVGASAYEYDGQMHWPSASGDGRILKSPNHPTAWMEFFMQENGIDPNALGLSTYEKALEWEKAGKPMPLGVRLYGKDGMGREGEN